jgi:cell division protein FtsW (lipid II flippase)
MVSTLPPSLARPPFYKRLPPFQRGPKPKRRTELGLLLFGGVIVVCLYVIASLGTTSHIPPHLGPFLGVLLSLSIVGHLANRWLAPNANPVVLPLAELLNGIGYVVIARWDPGFASAQAGWSALGIVFYVATLLVIRRSRDLDRYRYLLLLLAVVLMLLPLVPHIGLEIYGARLWAHIGHLQFQPVEIAKILLCVFFASYFADKKELLSIPTARFGNRLIVDPRPLIPILLAWGFAMVVIGAENDIGFALLIFTLFIALLWISAGRARYLVFGLVLFAGGVIIATQLGQHTHLFSQFHVRVSTWLDPWKTSQSGGFDLVQSWYSLGAGGVGGVGLGLGHNPFVHVAPITSDFIFVGIGEELGLMGATAVVFGFLLLCGAGLRIAQTARSDFSRLMAVGLTILIGFQAFFIMAGITRLLPLTGITLPFMAYGGSSLVSNYIVIALLMRISEEGSSTPDERRIGVKQPGEQSFQIAT